MFILSFYKFLFNVLKPIVSTVTSTHAWDVNPRRAELWGCFSEGDEILCVQGYFLTEQKLC